MVLRPEKIIYVCIHWLHLLFHFTTSYCSGLSSSPNDDSLTHTNKIYESPRQTRVGAQHSIDGVHSLPFQTYHMLKQHIDQYTTVLPPLYTILSPHFGSQDEEVPLYSHSLRHLVESKGTPWCVGDHQRLLRGVEATDSATKRIRFIRWVIYWVICWLLPILKRQNI